MKSVISVLFVFSIVSNILLGQTSPCSEQSILQRQFLHDPNADLETQKNEAFIQSFIQQLRKERSEGAHKNPPQYIIPVVIHVFHHGDTAKLDMAQIQSGLDILNQDMNGLNSDFNSVIPRFDSIKGTLDIEFCLATIDPNGNPTTGVIYYDDSLGMTNSYDLFVHAWDNYKYMNIYLPRYVWGTWSLFTAFAYYPSTPGSNQNRAGVFYSSNRWGYGTHSELTPGQEWGSVISHEVGHWLDLRHTFEFGCNSNGDFIDDTPNTLGTGIQLSGCFNNDMSCGVPTNGSNYMDYNHDCKRMFTKDQVDRMIAALNLPSRKTLWSDTNLVATGCKRYVSIQEQENQKFNVYPNPSKGEITVHSESFSTFEIFDLSGKVVAIGETNQVENLSFLERGMYLVKTGNSIQKILLE
ncbi:MAG: zinc-dependent metalloprotease [Schleiferiaceae bacterium]|jgi:hypothetical protein|nr:zinc-dependent metalloprotease [Schleiferiaceae bacterium]